MLVALAVVLAACSDDGGGDATSEEEASKEFTMVADVRLSGSDNVTGDLAACSGVGRFVDLYRGALAIVTDETGKPIATGTVTNSLGTNYYREILDECSFRVRVGLVPRSKGYFLVIGRQYPRALAGDLIDLRKGYTKFDLNEPNVRGAPY